jgi:hypothetical protein
MILLTGKGRARTRRNGTEKWLGAVIAVALCAAPATLAAQHVLTWNGTTWDGDWKPGPGAGFPTNTATDTYSLLIDGGKATSSEVKLQFARPTLDSVVIDSGDTLSMAYQAGLTLTTGLTLDGTLQGDAGAPVGTTLALPAGVGLSGTGQVVNVSVTSAGGTFAIGSDMTVRASNPSYYISPTTIKVGGPDQPLVNQGHVRAERGGVVTLRGSSITNSGLLEATDGGVVEFDVPLTTITTLGKLSGSGGGHFRIANTLDNTGRTLALNGSTGDWELTGIMKGGTLTTADGTGLYVPQYTKSAVLDGVTIDGDLHLDGYDVEFRNSPVLNGSGRIYLDGLLVQAHSTAPSLVIGAGLTVVGRSYDGYPSGIGDTTRPTVNQGRLTTDGPGGVLRVNGSSFSNQGRIDVGSGGVLGINAPFRVADLGTFTNDGAIRIVGTLDNVGQTLVLSPAMGAWEVTGTIRGGSIETPADKYLTIPDNESAVLDDVQLNGRLVIGKPGPFGYRFGAALHVPAGQTLHGSGDVLVASRENSTITGDGGLTVAAGMTIHGTGGTVGDPSQPLTNYGLISADVVPNVSDLPGNGDLTVAGSTFANQGTFEARNGGALRFFGDYKLADLGRIVNAGGVIRFDGTLDNTGQVLEVNDATGPRELVGILKGGTIRSDAAHPLVVPAVVSHGDPNSIRRQFDGVTLDGVVRVDKYPLAIAGGLLGRGEVQLTQEGGLSTTEPSLVIGPELVVRSIGPKTTINAASVVNRGEVRQDAPRAGFTFSGDLTNEGTIRVAGSGEIRVEKTFRMADNAVLSIVLDDNFSEEFSVGKGLDLSGVADTLELTMGPNTKLNTRYLLIYYGGSGGVRTGEFDRVTPGFVLDYSVPNGIFVTAVPEPAGVAGGSAVVVALAGRRRRCRA